MQIIVVDDAASRSNARWFHSTFNEVRGLHLLNTNAAIDDSNRSLFELAKLRRQ